MTLEHLFSMTAGFDCDDSGDRPGDEDTMRDQTAEPDWYRFSLNATMAWKSGDQIVYCSMKPNLVAGMLEKIAGEPLPELFHRPVTKPLHMLHEVARCEEVSAAAIGMAGRMQEEMVAVLTQFFLNDRKWEGKQIVSRDWARKSGSALRALSPTSGQTHGYLWNSWEYPYRGREHGGQVWIPEFGLLIAFTGSNYADRVLFRPQRNFVPDEVLPAVR